MPESSGGAVLYTAVYDGTDAALADLAAFDNSPKLD